MRVLVLQAAGQTCRHGGALWEGEGAAFLDTEEPDFHAQNAQREGPPDVTLVLLQGLAEL